MTSFENPELNLTQLIERMIQSKVLEIHTATPGIVTKYNPEKQVVDVQVAIKRKVKSTGVTLPVPILKDIPVLFPRTAKSDSHFPLAKGDGVLLIFCERNIDPWSESDGSSPVDPDVSPRFHDFNDAIAIPGLFPSGKPMTFDSPAERDGSVLTSEFLKVSLTTEKKIYLARKGETPTEPVPLGSQLVDLITELIAQVKAISTALQGPDIGIGNMGAPVPPSAALKTALGDVDSALDDAAETYLTTESTNILSKVTFTERGE